MTEHAAGFDLHAAVAAATTVKRGQIQLIPAASPWPSRPATKPDPTPQRSAHQKRESTMINAPEPSTPTTRRSPGPPHQPRPADFTIEARHAHRPK